MADLDYSNKFFLGMRNDKIAPIVPIKWPLSPDDALILAAWLVAMAEVFSQQNFAKILRTVQSRAQRPPASPQSENWRKLAVDYLACICVPPCDLTTNEPCWRCATRWALIAAADACDDWERRANLMKDLAQGRGERIAALEEFAKKCVHSEWVKLHDDLLCIPLADALTRATANTGRTTK